jgi:hypothetical protein
MSVLATIALGVAKQFVGFADKRASSEVERFRIQTGYDEAVLDAKVQQGAQAASVIKAGMQFKVFWIPWLIAAVPCSIWFGWGMLDSAIMDGSVLPDTAELPPDLRHYADIVFANIFYSGAGMGAVQAGSQVIANALARRR